MGLLRRATIGVGLLAAVLTTATAAKAQATESKNPTGLGLGVIAGVGLNPNELVIGAQYALGKPVGIFRMVPNAHVGFDAGATLDVNWDFLARFEAKDSKFGFYGGASPTVAFGSDTKFGGNIIVGMQFPMIADRATNLEARFGFGGVPNCRILLTVVL